MTDEPTPLAMPPQVWTGSWELTKIPTSGDPVTIGELFAWNSGGTYYELWRIDDWANWGTAGKLQIGPTKSGDFAPDDLRDVYLATLHDSATRNKAWCLMVYKPTAFTVTTPSTHGTPAAFGGALTTADLEATLRSDGSSCAGATITGHLWRSRKTNTTGGNKVIYRDQYLLAPGHTQPSDVGAGKVVCFEASSATTPADFIASVNVAGAWMYIEVTYTWTTCG